LSGALAAVIILPRASIMVLGQRRGYIELVIVSVCGCGKGVAREDQDIPCQFWFLERLNVLERGVESLAHTLEDTSREPPRAGGVDYITAHLKSQACNGYLVFQHCAFE